MIARPNPGCCLALVLGLFAIAADAHAQCGQPDLNQEALDDADIFDISDNDLITVIADPFPDNSLIEFWIVIRPTPSHAPGFHPIVFFEIVSNQHFDQSNICVFSAAEDLENQPGWVFYEVSRLTSSPRSSASVASSTRTATTATAAQLIPASRTTISANLRR